MEKELQSRRSPSIIAVSPGGLGRGKTAARQSVVNEEADGMREKGRLLLVSGPYIDRALLERVFGEEYDIRTAEAEQVRKLLMTRKEGYSAMLLDCCEAEEQRMDLLRTILREPPLAELPVLVAVPDAASAARALHLGAAECFAVPVVPELLRLRVNYTVEKRILEAGSSLQTLWKAARRADCDPLTGLYRKETFYQTTRKLLDSYPGEKFVLIRWNVERFKLINDLFGQEMGDRVLETIADCLRDTMPEKATYGRLEADHFALCLPASESNPQWRLAEVSERLQKLGINHTVSVDAGIYEIEDPSLPVAQMCDRASLALKTIDGKYHQNFSYYTDELRNAMLREQDIRSQMESALEQRQFQVYLQPVCSLSAGRPVGAEALVRWIHPTRGTIAPGEFIPIFEKNGFITALDRYVWEEVCRYLSNRKEQGLQMLPISVNASRASLCQEDLCGEITALTQRYGVEPRLFRIEITETDYAEQPQQLQDVTQQLQKAGYEVLMDDFGSGYSGLNTLKDIPADMMKIDMKFLQGFERGGRVGTVLISVLRMARWLNIPVIAEGVETEEQLAFLYSVGCDLIQGYCFARPMPLQEFERYLNQASEARPEPRPQAVSHQDLDLLLGGNDLINRLMEGMFGGFGLYEYRSGRMEVLRVNEGYYRILGETPATVHEGNENIWDSAYPEDAEMGRAACLEAVQTGRAVRRILRRNCRQTEKAKYLDCIFHLLNGNESNALLCVAFNDITDQLEAQMELQRTTEQAQTVLNTIPAGIDIFLADRNTCAMEPIYESIGRSRTMGYTQEELLELCRKDPFALVYSKDLERVKTAYQNTIRSGKRLECTYRQYCRDGQPRWMRVTCSALEDGENKLRLYSIYTDVQELMETQKRLVYRDQLSQLLLANSTTSTMDYQVEEDRLQVNYLDKSGTRRELQLEHFMEKGCGREIAQGDCGAAEQSLRRLLKTGKDQTFEARYNFDGRGFRWYRCVLTCVEDEQGRVVRAVGKLEDISEERKARRWYQEQKALNEALSADLLSAYRINLTRMMIEYRYGGGKEQSFALGRELNDALFLHCCREQIPDTEECKRCYESLRPSALRKQYDLGHQQIEVEYRIRQKDNQSRWVRTEAKLMRQPDTGELMAFYNTRDIHESRVTKAMVESVVQTDYDFLMHLDTCSGQYMLFSNNKRVTRQFPVRAGSYEEQRWSLLNSIHPEDRKNWAQELSLAGILQGLRTEERYTVNFRLLEENGQLACKKVTCTWLDSDHSAVMLARTDITDQVEQENTRSETLRQALSRAEASRREMDRFLIRTYHEIRTPMNAIIGMSGLALGENGVPGVVRDYLSRIQYAGEYMLTLVNDILDVRRTENGEIHINLAPCALEEYVEQLDALTRPDMERKAIALRIDGSHIQKQVVMMDKSRVLQIFVNLLSSIAQYTSEGGSIHCTLYQAKLEEGEMMLQCDILAEGVAMAREFVGRLLRPFDREEGEPDGSGLGLILAKRMLSGLGGALTAENRKEGCVLAHVNLPLRRATQEQADSAGWAVLGDDFNFQGRRVLVAEDQMEQAKALKAMLEEKRFEVEMVKDGHQAADSFAAHEPGWYSALLVDTDLPNQESLLAIRQIRQMDRSDARTIPVVALVETGQETNLQAALAAGMDEYLKKPMEPRLLYQTLAALIFAREGHQTDRESEKRIRQQEKIYKLLLTQSHSRVFEYDAKNDQLTISGGGGSQGGISIVAELVQKVLPISAVVHPDYRGQIAQALLAGPDGEGDGELLFLADFYGGGYRWYNAFYKCIGAGKNYRIVGRVDDVDEKTRRTLLLQEKAEYDPITGLYNRATFQELVQNALGGRDAEVDGAAAFVEFDLDNFKLVNDTKGHLVGDDLLRVIGQTVQACCRREDLVGRLGGDEFAIWMENVGNAENVTEKVRRLRQRFQEVTAQLDLGTSVTASFGIAMVTPADHSFNDLFQKADIAMYQAKRKGKNSWAVYAGENET